VSSYLGFGLQGKGTCARLALRHALLCLGVPTRERDITRAMRRGRLRTRWFGSDESAILRGVRALGATPVEIRAETARDARAALHAQLRDGAPCILCVSNASGEGWGHWAVLAGRDAGRYVWIDSSDDRVVGAWTWRSLDRWLVCRGEERPYYAIAVRGRGAAAQARSLVPRIAAARAALRDERLRAGWGERLAALAPIFDAASGGAPAGQIFARVTEGDARERHACRAVAEAHDLRVGRLGVERAVAAVTALVRG
jgi:hypothetical protein